MLSVKGMKEVYNEIREKHPILPSYNRMDKEFEISFIETENLMLKQVKIGIILFLSLRNMFLVEK